MRWGRGRSYASHTNYWLGRLRRGHLPWHPAHTTCWLGWLARRDLSWYPAQITCWFSWLSWRHLSWYASHITCWLGWLRWRHLSWHPSHTTCWLGRLSRRNLSTYTSHANYWFGRLGLRDLPPYAPHAHHRSCWLLSGPRIYLGIWRRCGTRCSKLIAMTRLRPSIRSVCSVNNLLLPIWLCFQFGWFSWGTCPPIPPMQTGLPSTIAKSRHWLSLRNPSPYTTHTDHRSCWSWEIFPCKPLCSFNVASICQQLRFISPWWPSPICRITILQELWSLLKPLSLQFLWRHHARERPLWRHHARARPLRCKLHSYLPLVGPLHSPSIQLKAANLL